MRSGTFTVRFGDEAHQVAVGPGGEARVDGDRTVTVVPDAPGAYRVDDGAVRRLFVTGTGERRQVFVDGEVYDFVVGTEPAGRRRAGRAASDMLTAPMPARVTTIAVAPGQAVRKGDVLLKLEAMKMELAVRAPRDGVVSIVACKVGELVQPGVGLLEIA